MATANGETSATEANGGSASTSGRGDSPSPSSSTAALPTPTAHPPPQLPPFLNKCYDMVEDPSTDHMVSWGAEGNSFVIWDPHTFSKELLPKYFKHDNLASFVRQLNTYSFRKVDPDRWEFANDGFLKGQKHLLKTIVRKKASQVVAQPKKSEGKNASVKACIEVGKFGLEEEIQRLKRDKNILMQELVKIKQNQQTTDAQLRSVRERVQVMEQNQQQMLSFLAMAVQNPGFLAQVVQQNVNPRWTETNKKRRLPALEPAKNDENAPCDGQIVKYQPLSPENWKPFLTPVSNTVIIPEHDPLLVGINGLNLSVDDNHDISSIMKPYTQTEEEFLMDIPDDYLDQLLTNSPLEDTASVDLQSLDIPPIDMDFDFMEAEIGVEASNDLSMSSEQMTVEHLASEKNKEHKMV